MALNLENINEGENSLPLDEKAIHENEVYSNDKNLESLTANDLMKTKIDRKNSLIDRIKQDTLLRRMLSKAFAIIIGSWLFCVIGILVISMIYTEGLSDKVLITLLTTSTINVIGMMLIILKNLFPDNRPVVPKKNNTKKIIKKK